MMLSVKQARAAVLACVEALDPIEVGLDDAYGLVTAGPVMARELLPRFDNSAVHGFAIRARDTAETSSARPVRLRIAGEVRAAAGKSPPDPDTRGHVHCHGGGRSSRRRRDRTD